METLGQNMPMTNVGLLNKGGIKMAYTYVEVDPYFENTTMQACYNENNVLRVYKISPTEGYVLHIKGYDTPVIDEETMKETGEIRLGYTSSFTTVGYNYNFETNPSEIYAVLESSVPADQIFDGENNDHETM